jgi:hypothetical protein
MKTPLETANGRAPNEISAGPPISRNFSVNAAVCRPTRGQAERFARDYWNRGAERIRTVRNAPASGKG